MESLCQVPMSQVDAAVDLSSLPRVGGRYLGAVVKITNSGFFLWLLGQKCLVYVPYDNNFSFEFPKQNEDLFVFRVDRYCRYERGQDGIFCEGSIFKVWDRLPIDGLSYDAAAKPLSIDIPDCFRAMGFDKIPSEEKLKEQFRKEALQAHPDTGGTAKKFIILKNNYEKCKEYLHI